MLNFNRFKAFCVQKSKYCTSLTLAKPEASQWRRARLFGRAGSNHNISVANSRTNSFPASPPLWRLGIDLVYVYIYIHIHPLLYMWLITENLYGNMASQQLARCNWVRCMIVTSNCSDGKACHSRVCGCRLRAWLHVCLHVLMGAISFDGTLPVCSWVCVNICGWKGALLKSFLCVNAWAGFCMCLSVYWRICQKQLKGTKKGKSQVKTWRSVLLHFGCVFSPCCIQHFCPFLNRDICTCSCCVLAVILMELIAYAEHCTPVMWFTSVEPFR